MASSSDRLLCGRKAENVYSLGPNRKRVPAPGLELSSVCGCFNFN